MHGVIHFAPHVDTVLHPVRVSGLGVTHVEAHLDVFVLRPVLDDTLSEMVPGTCSLFFSSTVLLVAHKLAVVEARKIDETDKRVV